MSRKPRRKTRRTTRTMHNDAPALEIKELKRLRWFDACKRMLRREVRAIMRKKRS